MNLKALEKAKISKPEWRGEKGGFCYPTEYGLVTIGKSTSHSGLQMAIIDIDEAIMIANFIIDTFTDRAKLPQFDNSPYSFINPEAHEQTK